MSYTYSRVVPEPMFGHGVPIDRSKHEWRCNCKSNGNLDLSANPSYVSECTRCHAKRPEYTCTRRLDCGGGCCLSMPHAFTECECCGDDYGKPGTCPA